MLPIKKKFWKLSPNASFLPEREPGDAVNQLYVDTKQRITLNTFHPDDYLSQWACAGLDTLANKDRRYHR